MTTEWQFEENGRDGRPGWSWRRLVSGEPDAVSTPAFRELGLAVRDAIIHGFQPRKHRWLTITRLGVIHFHPGKTAESSPARLSAPPAGIPGAGSPSGRSNPPS